MHLARRTPRVLRFLSAELATLAPPGGLNFLWRAAALRRGTLKKGSTGARQTPCSPLAPLLNWSQPTHAARHMCQRHNHASTHANTALTRYIPLLHFESTLPVRLDLCMVDDCRCWTPLLPPMMASTPHHWHPSSSPMRAVTVLGCASWCRLTMYCGLGGDTIHSLPAFQVL